MLIDLERKRMLDLTSGFNVTVQFMGYLVWAEKLDSSFRKSSNGAEEQFERASK